MVKRLGKKGPLRRSSGRDISEHLAFDETRRAHIERVGLSASVNGAKYELWYLIYDDLQEGLEHQGFTGSYQLGALAQQETFKPAAIEKAKLSISKTIAGRIHNLKGGRRQGLAFRRSPLE